MRSLMGLMAQPVATLILATAIIRPALAIGNSSSSVINTTCAALKLQPYDDCVRVLSADPAAANATDARGVAAAAVNITARKANSTLQIITSLINNLNTCREYYGAMEEKLASVLTDFRTGRQVDDEEFMKIMDAAGEPNNCDIILFEADGHKDPISDKNSENNTLANLASDILKSIVKKVLKRGT